MIAQVKKVRKTPAQKKALDAYNFAVQQEDRYLGSVFANEKDAREHEAKVKAAYDECKRLGMGVEHGL
jgi:ABC-type enterochelin transport system substrate-binding protein